MLHGDLTRSKSEIQDACRTGCGGLAGDGGSPVRLLAVAMNRSGERMYFRSADKYLKY